MQQNDEEHNINNNEHQMLMMLSSSSIEVQHFFDYMAVHLHSRECRQRCLDYLINHCCQGMTQSDYVYCVGALEKKLDLMFSPLSVDFAAASSPNAEFIDWGQEDHGDEDVNTPSPRRKRKRGAF